MNRLSCNIGYLRDDNAPKHLQWQKIGKLHYYPDSHSSRIFLFGWRQGLCIAKPDNWIFQPFLRGEITCPVGNTGFFIDNLFVGAISTSESESNGEVLYSIRMCAMPLVLFQQPSGVWLEVALDDAEKEIKITEAT